MAIYRVEIIAIEEQTGCLVISPSRNIGVRVTNRYTAPAVVYYGHLCQ